MSSQLSAELTHWHFDTYNAKWSEAWMNDSFVSFHLDEHTGTVSRLDTGGRSYVKIE